MSSFGGGGQQQQPTSITKQVHIRTFNRFVNTTLIDLTHKYLEVKRERREKASFEAS